MSEEAAAVEQLGRELAEARETNARLNRRCQAAEHFAAVFRRESENLRGLEHFVNYYKRVLRDTRRRVDDACRNFTAEHPECDAAWYRDQLQQSHAEFNRLRAELARRKRENPGPPSEE